MPTRNAHTHGWNQDGRGSAFLVRTAEPTLYDSGASPIRRRAVSPGVVRAAVAHGNDESARRRNAAEPRATDSVVRRSILVLSLCAACATDNLAFGAGGQGGSDGTSGVKPSPSEPDDTSDPSGAGGTGTGSDPTADSSDGGGDTSSPDHCGNDELDPGEACDGALLGGASCRSERFAGGTLACHDDCTLDFTGCSGCGNDRLEPGEICDGDQMTTDCGDYSFEEGEVSCTPGCEPDLSDCFTCGDGIRTGPEACDTDESASCKGFGWTAGLAFCDGCQWELDDCCQLEGVRCQFDDECCEGTCPEGVCVPDSQDTGTDTAAGDG